MTGAPLHRCATLLALLGVVLAGCVSQTDGSPQSRQSMTGSFDEPSPPARDPSQDAGPPDEEGSGGPADAASVNPCSLVTKQEADRIAGVTLQPAVRARQLCTFPTPTTGAVGQLEIYVGDGAKQYFDIDKINLKHTFRRVPDVGDQAWLEDGAIFVHTKGTWFGLRLTRLDAVDTGPALAKLAATVAGRL